MDCDVNVFSRYLVTTLNSYRVFASRPVTVRDKLLRFVVNFQSLSPTLWYFILYLSILVAMIPLRGIIDIFALESVTDTMVGG